MDKTFVEEDFMMTGMGGANGNNPNIFGAGAFSMPQNNGIGTGGLNMPMNMGAMQSMMYMGVPPNMASMYNPSASNSMDDLGSAAIEFPPELGGDPPKLTPAAATLNSGGVMDPTSMMGMNPMMAAGMNPHLYMSPAMQQMQYNPMFGGYAPQNLNMLQQHQMLQAQQQQYMQFMQQNMLNMNNNQTNLSGNSGMLGAPATNGLGTPQQPHPSIAQPSAVNTATSAANNANNNNAGSWRSPSDDPQRKDVIGRIIRFLQMQKPNAPPDWIRRLPQMARKLEEALYRKANSKQEYNDMNTLQQRLHVVAQEFKNKDWRSTDDNGIRQDLIHRIVMLLRAQNPNATPDWINRLPHMAKKLEEMLYQKATSKAEYTDNARLKERLQVVATEIHKNNQKKGVPPPTTAPKTELPTAPTAPSGPAKMEAIAMPAELNNPFLDNARAIASILTPRTITEYNHKVLTMIQNIGQHRVVLMRQQQRLMQLKHACECKQDKCAQLACAEMKPLWAHIQTCPENENCSTPHCVSSKYVLAHYQQCMKSTCVVCASLNQPPQPQPTNSLQQQHQFNHMVQQQQKQHLQQQQFKQNSLPPHHLVGAAMSHQPLQMPLELKDEGKPQSHFASQAKIISSTLPENIIRDYHQKVDFMMNDSTQLQHQSILQRQQQRLLELRHASECKLEKCTQPSCHEMKPLWAHVLTCRQADTCSTPHCVSSKYVLAHYQHCAKPNCVVCLPLRDIRTEPQHTADKIRQFTEKAKGAANMLTTRQTQEYHAKVLGMMHVKCVAQNQTILERQQQRLLHLRHALFCPTDKCVLPYCAEMKKLWTHVMGCKKSESCAYAHCLSSKYVLSHFQQCTNPACVVCALVRDAGEMEKSMEEEARANAVEKKEPAAPSQSTAPLKRGSSVMEADQQPPMKKPAPTPQTVKPPTPQAAPQPIPMPANLPSAPPKPATPTPVKADKVESPKPTPPSAAPTPKAATPVQQMIACPPELLKDEDEFTFMDGIEEELGDDLLGSDELAFDF
ncbi:hypothetical protein H310_10363 [Aphanomyces invadans]|uniref:histone acetyltransferase n=1 Tax=Aphanomyces invadans TaxID=157072 RepID=A0A024TS23_9STRA|nr:hypothetical protein H310_10363 [Aphanomyces invadans]ETV96162.1 hypothetical protein H310_10363 [Aphanomyces invadans]|eukprot:XP_008874954.1 hypothetical protein H310_10363 [Aphanomyces invadans]